MRRFLAALCLALALALAGAASLQSAGALQLGATPVATESASGWRPAARAARTYASRRTGFTSFALRTRRRLYAHRGGATNRSASVVKAMLMVAYLNHRSVRGRKLSGAEHGLLGPMIRRSDNGAASQVRNFVGNGALVHLARRVGMREFGPNPVWGATRISARDQTKLFLNIDRFVVRRHRRFAMRLLGSIVSYQRWGIAHVRPRGWALYFKGGWVPGTENQVGLLRRGDRRVAVAVLTAGQGPGYARETEREVARRLLRGLGPDSVPR